MAAAISFLQATSSGADASEYTFSSQNLGTAAADRRIIVAVHNRKLGGSTTVAVTVGGVTASNVVTRWAGASNDNVAALFVAEVPTGTTGDVVVTFGAGALRCGIALWRATGIDTTAFDTNSAIGGTGADPISATIDVEAGGFAVAGLTFTSTNSTASWSGLTQQYQDTMAGESAAYTGSHDAFASAQTGLSVTATPVSSNDRTLVVASWSASTGTAHTRTISSVATSTLVDS